MSEQINLKEGACDSNGVSQVRNLGVPHQAIFQNILYSAIVD